MVFAELSATANYGSRRRCARQCASLRLRPLTRFVLHISLVVSVGIPLCSYGTSYRRVYALSTARPCARWCLRRLTRSVRRVVSMVILGGGCVFLRARYHSTSVREGLSGARPSGRFAGAIRVDWSAHTIHVASTQLSSGGMGKRDEPPAEPGTCCLIRTFATGTNLLVRSRCPAQTAGVPRS